MSQKRMGERRRIAGLTCGQILLLLLLVMAIASGAAIAFGYSLGLFDRPPLAIPPTATSLVDQELLVGSPVSDQTEQPTGPDEVTPTETRSSATSSTATQVPTQTKSVPATLTPTIPATAPANVCAQFDLRFLNATSNVVAWRASNPSGQPFVLSQIEVSWPIANDAVFNAFVDGHVIWSGEDLLSPTFITNWIGDHDDRDIMGVSRLEILFGTAAAANGYDLKLHFENGCVASASR